MAISPAKAFFLKSRSEARDPYHLVGDPGPRQVFVCIGSSELSVGSPLESGGYMDPSPASRGRDFRKKPVTWLIAICWLLIASSVLPQHSDHPTLNIDRFRRDHNRLHGDVGRLQADVAAFAVKPLERGVGAFHEGDDN